MKQQTLIKEWGHDELLRDLATHLRANPDRMHWLDTNMGSAGSIRPDIFAMMKSFASPKPMAYEIKISRADFLSDVTSGKWQGYLEYAQGVYFCVPKGLVKKNEVPQGAGLMVRSEKGWRATKRVTLGQGKPTFDAMMKLLIDAHGVGYWARQHQGWSNYYAMQKIKKRFGEDTAKIVADLPAALDMLEDAKAGLADVRDAHEVHKQRNREQAIKMADKLKSDIAQVLTPFREAFNLPEEAAPKDILFALGSAQRQLDENTELRRARTALKRLQRCFEDIRGEFDLDSILGNRG